MRHAAEYWVLDFDRCLGSDALYTDAYIAGERLDGTIRDELRRVQAQVQAEGGSFDIVGYLDACSEPLRGAFTMEYAKLTRQAGMERYRTPGATTLLAYLKTRDIPFMIMTYGGVSWQKAKLHAAGFDDLSVRIVEQKEKADIIADWYSERQQGFIVDQEHITAKKICLVDDKAIAFAGLPKQARGYWVHHPENLLPSQQGSVPPGVVEVASLGNILEKERQLAGV